LPAPSSGGRRRKADPSFAGRVDARDITIGVVGLGYVGLPLAIAYVEAGFTCAGFDVAEERTSRLEDGRSYIDDVSHGRVAAAVGSGRFQATCDPSVLSRTDVVFICVPTPFDSSKTPDLSYVCAATATVASILRPGMLVILQSTTHPGTTVEIVQPVLEEGGLQAGVDFHLAFSPERVDPGNAVWTVHNTPKVVGGLTPQCSERAKAVLEAVMETPGLVRVVVSPAAAEMAKLLENTYRAVNIALVNELAMLAHEMRLDIWEVIAAASTKPFGFQAFFPGIGPGGHCIPVDPYYLSWKAREFDFQTKFIELAADTNLRMASYVVGRILDFMNRLGRTVNGSRILCLGAAFKAGVSDTRNSRATRVMELLEEAGARVDYADPLVSEIALPSGPRKSIPLAAVAWGGFDLVVVLTDDPSWPVEDLLATDMPLFDAVNAFGTPKTPLHERL
jgi:UDP-N-acetyl-D-glucosamine dehydrogenase